MPRGRSAARRRVPRWWRVGRRLRGRSNPLVERFIANDTFQQRYGSRLEELRSQLFDSGAAQELVDRWVDVVTSRADDLVATDVIESDAASVAAFLESQTSG